MPFREQRIEDVHEWVAALNAWKDVQVQEWVATPQWDAVEVPASHRDDGEGGAVERVRNK